ncbi:ABC transporter ATP-binding protein [Bradyrhizobium sp. Y36]|uniref:ABC transporter ATP-binding protein n=1 Tax=Bradyrhizobium sp. Y36 TaxID=2035447 RepID=UPI000BE86EB5|nr:ABC transporter ATP-binding protein [Bradyrhizobium sp. Y36]PDT82265.1 ABC transporter ATP-binding protein [Bradyrhizobium sp. Y36]
MARIELENLAHSYFVNPQHPWQWALKPMNMSWKQGGAYALLGPSGCGKTTLLNVISGLVTPSHGKILFDGRDVSHIPTEARNIAQVFQFPVVYDTMTVAENLAFPLQNRGVAKDVMASRVRQVAHMLGLEPLLGRRARGLTADLKQKVSLGRGLVRSDVGAILFDEPLTVIDPHLKWQLRAQIRRVHAETDVTMIYVTHDQTEALTFADHVVVMYQGEVVQVGTPQELFDKPAHTFVGYFIGSPGMNVLPAELDGNQARVGSHVLSLSTRFDGAAPGGTYEIGIRPEHLKVARNGPGLPAAVRRVDDIGRIKIVHCEMDGMAISAVTGEDDEVPSDGVVLVPESTRIHLYRNSHRVE